MPHEKEATLRDRLQMATVSQTRWPIAQEILRLWVDTEDKAMGLPRRKLEDLRQRLESWPPREAMVQGVLSFAGKLRHAAYIV